MRPPDGLDLMITIEQIDWTDGPQKTRMSLNSEGLQNQKGTPMHHKYDLFEKFPDGSSLWRSCVIGLEGARRHMFDLAQQSPNQFYAMHLMSGKIVCLDLQQGAFNVSSKTERRGSAASA
jgi:hypothetical protein